jgi:glucose-6-phosphate isomerase
MAVEAVGLYLDYSKNRITDETWSFSFDWLKKSVCNRELRQCLRGEKINLTENRAVLHTALRAPERQSIVVDGENVVPKVHAVLDKMAGFSDRVRSGAWKGPPGNAFATSLTSGSAAPISASHGLRGAQAL